MNVFAEFAPKYWAAGIPAMPLKVKSKAPLLNEWTSYGAVFPSTGVREHWLVSHPNSNIGLPFGEASGLFAIDIDTVDQDLVDIIMDTLPASPWVRIGKKGCALLFKWQGQANFKIRDDNGMICEGLGKGNQLVLPPSIHPDTGEPYTANCDLWDVMDKIQPLPADIEEKLRSALGVKGGVSLAREGRSAPMVVVPQGERDIQLVKHAGYLARVVAGIDKAARITLAQAIDHMYTWVTQYTVGVAGDSMDPEKGVAKLLEFLLRDLEDGRTLPDGWDEGLTADQEAHPTIVAMRGAQSEARWTVSRAREWLREQCELKPDDTDWGMLKVEELISAVAQDEQFTEFQVMSLFSYMCQWVEKKALSKPEVRKLFKEARAAAGETGEMDEDHEALALRALEIINREGELRFATGSFWQWNGSCFVQLTDEDIMKHVMSIKGNVLSRRANDYKSIVGVVKVLAGRELIEVGAPGVNFANGFLDIDGHLHDHAPVFGQTFTMPFNYAPERAGEAHKWLAFLERVWGDDEDYAEKVAALQEAFAATMFGIAPRYQRAILLYGRARTGKSTVLEVLQAMMPPAAVSAVAPERWSEKFALTSMVGRTLNICGELSETRAIDGSRFKEIVEGTEQETEFKGKDSFRFKPIAAQWFASNHPPISRDGSEGFLRRWLILHFANQISSEEKIDRYAEVLVAEEREAIAAWAVQGLVRLLRTRDYTLPRSHWSHLNAMLRANNDVAAWIQSNGKVRNAEGEWADAQGCYDQFRWYQKDNLGMVFGKVLSFERFMQMMAELGYRIDQYQDTLDVMRFRIWGVKSEIPVM